MLPVLFLESYWICFSDIRYLESKKSKIIALLKSSMLQKSYFDYRKPLTLDDMLVSQAVVFSIKVLIEVFVDQKVVRTVGLLIG